ncbi:MAG: NUDIX domain-containing protein [Rhodospirillales bacterium]|jgi:ADP-ribose pyrophosphatase|nr:NUDIX domain-containing protein [Rhodospirillales bacterium]
MNKKDVEIIEKEQPFKGYFRIDRYTVRHKLFEGGWSGPVSRECLERGHAVTALLYDADLDFLVFVEQFRIGAHAAHDSPWWGEEASPWMTECVAGIIDEGETPENVVRREAVEEAGCEVTDLVPIMKILASPGACSETVFVYCGRTDASNAGGVHGLDHEDEDIRVVRIPAAEAFVWLDAGKFIHSATIIAVQWFRENHTHLRARWRSTT